MATSYPRLLDARPAEFKEGTLYPCPNPIAIATADFNRDGHPDLVVVSRWNTNAASQVNFYYGNGDGTFRAGQKQFSADAFNEVWVVSLNGETARDLALEGSRNHVQFYEAREDETYVKTGTGRPFIPAGMYSATLGSFEGSEGLDVAALSGNGLFVFKGEKEASLKHSLARQIKLETRGSCVIAADVDGDGMNDLVVAYGERDSGTVLLNGVTAPFAQRKTFQPGIGVWSMAARDLNGDGKVDLAAANRMDNTVSVALGNGDGTFGRRSVVAVGNVPGRVYVEDINNDGKPDVLCVNEASGDISFLIGRGDGSFESSQPLRAGRMPLQAAIADFNHDGKLDIAVVNFGDQTVRVFLNTTPGSAPSSDSGAKPPAPSPPKLSAKVIPAFSAEDEVRAWSTEDGLPRNSLKCTYQSPDGFIWVSSQDSVVRYDGREFLTFDIAEGCTQICAARDGVMYAVGEGGLFRLESGKFKKVPEAPSGRLYRICAAKGGGVYFSSPQALYHYQAGRVVTLTNWVRFVWGPGAEATWIHALAEDAEGNLWCSWEDLLLRRDTKSGRFEIIFRGLKSPWEPEGVTQIQPLDDGSVWFCTGQGLWWWKKGEVRCYSKETSLLHFPIKSLCKDVSEGIWAGTAGRELHHIHGSEVSTFVLDAGLEPEGIRGITCDRAGGIWAATDTGGLKLLRRKPFRAITAKEGLALDDVRSVAEGTNGDITVATDQGFSILKKGHIYTDHRFNFRSAFVDSTGMTWLGGDPGLYSLQGTGLTRSYFVEKPTANYERVNSIYEDKEHRLWVASLPGLYCRSNGVWRAVQPPDPKYPWKYLSGVQEDWEGNLWVGSMGNGLTRIRDGEFKRFTKTDGLLDSSIVPVLVDTKGAVWFVSGGGIVRLKNGSFRTISTQDGLKENISFNILLDDYGWAWLNGMRGIYRVRKSDLDAVADGKMAKLQPVRFGTADGIVSTENNGASFPNSIKARDGRLWFPTTKGVVTVDPKTMPLKEQPLPILIEQVQANDRIIFTADGPGMEKGEGMKTISRGTAEAIQFRFSAPEFIAPERVRFRYRLSKRDTDWVEGGAQRYALYTHLKPGNYQFEVMAEDGHGLWTATPAKYAFAIAPFFYQTSWFIALCLGGLGCGLYGLHTLRMHYIKRIERLQAQHALDLERARIARDMHDELGASLTKIKLISELAEGVQELPAKALEQLRIISSTVQGVSRDMDEMVWSVNPENDTLERLVDYITNFSEEFLRLANLRLRLKVAETVPEVRLVSELRHEVIMVLKEALNNVAKHARASEVSVAVEAKPNLLRVSISDNGKGFEPVLKSQTRNGLSNMRSRVEKLKGVFEIQTKPGFGTTVQFALPLLDENHRRGKRGSLNTQPLLTEPPNG